MVCPDDCPATSPLTRKGPFLHGRPIQGHRMASFVEVGPVCLVGEGSRA